ncbi:MAG TPA: RusA family crossover junction endodeoxyribonuclease [Bacillus bacterium]|nr:RusA family crossover junction endodeoxyribonuclease [Bacillus sp. (in: firmicutes)]
MFKLSFFINPMGCVRMTQRGKFIKPNAQRYLSYKSFLQISARQQLKSKQPLKGALDVHIVFSMPIPKSWSNKRKCEVVGRYHTKKPDTDNLVKGVFDSLNKIAWEDDNQVAKVTAVKIYSEHPGIDVTVRELK